MTKYVVAKVSIDEEDGTKAEIGDKFVLLEEPNDFLTTMIFGALAEQGYLEDARIVDMGDSYVIFNVKKANGDGLVFDEIFDIVEES